MLHRFSKVVLGLAVVAALAATGTVAAKSQRSSASYNVGFIYPRTGLLGAYGAEEIEGFKLGLQYATNGTGKVNGKTINVTSQDDTGDPATGVSE
ncbi:MAG: ABC transporter substrate-binding protein, partial [Gaiellaceae bacterium]